MKTILALPALLLLGLSNNFINAQGYKPVAPADSVTDIDGYVYHIVKIGKQRWFQENLKTAHFRNGDTIPEMGFGNDWGYTGNHGNRGETGYPAWCYLERDKQNNYAYGKLYNWYAVTDQRNVCPTGYHVPSDEDFQLLSDFLGGDENSGAHMKAIKLWEPFDDSIQNAIRAKDEKYEDNTSGFTALPAGHRYGGGSFSGPGSGGTGFWSIDRFDRTSSWCRILYFGGPNLGHHNFDKRSGLSVRCVGN